MNIMSEAFGRALAEHRDMERQLLEKVEAEAMQPEELPEGQEKRAERVIVDGYDVGPAPRIAGKLSIRWSR